MVVNWGSTNPATWLSDSRFRLSPKWLNGSENVDRAINKLKFFQHFAGGSELPILRATSDREKALKWLKKGFGVVARKTLTGSSGAGIEIVQPGKELPEAPLYTRYYPKTHEFRFHVWKDGELIDFTQKKLKHDYPNSRRDIRSLDNGWVHAHDGLDLDTDSINAIRKACSECVASLGLDFGAVDVLGILDKETRELKSFRICEVNTGPGLENERTIQLYAEAILKRYQEHRNGLHIRRADAQVHGEVR